MVTRCGWVDLKSEEYIKYHDCEWGVPVHDDLKLFEFLILEGAQAGLSWLTVLKKRENYREAFDSFDYLKVSKYSPDKIEELLLNEEIIRNRLKVNSAVRNALAFIEVRKEFGSFDRYIWGFVNGKTIDEKRLSFKDIPATTNLSDLISKDLRKRGFNFVGSTIIYAFMQATGMINDHEASCFRYREL